MGMLYCDILVIYQLTELSLHDDLAHRLVNLPVFRALGSGSYVHSGVLCAYLASNSVLE